MEHTLIRPIVIENSSEYYRVGFAGEEKPYQIFKITNPTLKQDKDSKILELSPELLKIRRNPMENGNILNFDEIIHVWNYIFKDILKIKTNDYPVLIIEQPINSFNTQEKIAEIMFEQFKVPAFSLKTAPELVMRLMLKETGIVLDIQKEKTLFSVIWDFDMLRSDFQCFDIGLFDFNQRFLTVCEQVYQQIKKIKLLCHGGVELRKISSQNIVITGVGALIQDIKEKMTHILIELDSKNGAKPLEFIITSPKDPQNAIWLGRSKFAAQGVHQKNWISLEEFTENGPNSIHRI